MKVIITAFEARLNFLSKKRIKTYKQYDDTSIVNKKFDIVQKLLWRKRRSRLAESSGAYL